MALILSIKYTIYVHCWKIYNLFVELKKRVEKRAFGDFFYPVSQRVQINFILSGNVRIFCLSCNRKKKLKKNLKKKKKTAKLSENYGGGLRSCGDN
jgi:hypothetical protein